MSESYGLGPSDRVHVELRVSVEHENLNGYLDSRAAADCALLDVFSNGLHAIIPETIEPHVSVIETKIAHGSKREQDT